MLVPLKKEPTDPRQKILDAALKIFARNGYAGASVQEIVDQAGVTKPTLYYHFKSKAGLFQALVDHAADERYRVMRGAVEQHASLEKQLVAVPDALIRFTSERRDLMRLVFYYWFAAPGEFPHDIHCRKGWRNRDYFVSVIKNGIKKGELDTHYDGIELASGIMSQIFLYSMSQLIDPKFSRKPRLAQRIVRLYLDGAGPKRQTNRRAA